MTDGELVVVEPHQVQPWTPTGKAAEHAGRPDPDERLSAAAQQLILDGVNPRTAATYRSQWWKYVRWCGDTGRDHLPATPETIIEWMHEMGRRPGRYSRPDKFRPTAPTSVKLNLDVISVAHANAKRPEYDAAGRQLVGWASPTKVREVRLAYKGYIRNWYAAGHRPDTSYPLSPEEVEAMIATLDLRSTSDLMRGALFAVSYDAGFRRSEGCDLNWEDVEWHVNDFAAITENDFVVLHVPMSKTDQIGEGDEVVLYAHPEDVADTCPVRLLHRWMVRCTAQGVTITGPVFRRLRSGGPKPYDGRPKKATITAERMPASAVEDVIGTAAERAGLFDVPGRRRHITWHGLRSGSATAASERGADVPELSQHYRWKPTSPTPMRYVRRGRKRAFNPARRVWTKKTGK